MPKPMAEASCHGAPCPRCGSTIGVYSTRVEGQRRVRYLRCPTCHYKPRKNKVIVPLAFAPGQSTARPLAAGTGRFDQVF